MRALHPRLMVMLVGVLAAFCVLAASAQAVSDAHGFTIRTVAGNVYSSCSAGLCGIGGLATDAKLFDPEIAAGDGTRGFALGGPDQAAVSFVPAKSGTYFGQRMKGGHIYVIAGSKLDTECTEGSCGEGKSATGTTLATPADFAFDHAGDLVIADSDEQVVRFVPVKSGSYFGHKMKADHIYTVAGKLFEGCSMSCKSGVAATGATLDNPVGVAVDSAGDVDVANAYSDVVRVVPMRSGKHFGKELKAGRIYTIAGDYQQCESGSSPCGDGGPATSASLHNPYGVAVDKAGDLAITDGSGNAVLFVPASGGRYFDRQMLARHIYVIAGAEESLSCSIAPCGDGGRGTSAAVNYPWGITFDAEGNVLFVSNNASTVREVSRKSDQISAVAGQELARCTSAPCGKNGVGATSTKTLDYPDTIANYGSGFLVADFGEDAIRYLAPKR